MEDTNCAIDDSRLIIEFNRGKVFQPQLIHHCSPTWWMRGRLLVATVKEAIFTNRGPLFCRL